MSLYYTSLICVFAIVLALMVIDPNIGVFIDLQVRNLFVQIKRTYYLITIGTVVKINNWKLRREIEKMRREYDFPDDTDQ
jgi:hypothetical protein